MLPQVILWFSLNILTCLLIEIWNLIVLDIFPFFQVLCKFGVVAFLCFSNWRLWCGGHLICTIRTCEFLFVDVVLSRIDLLMWIYLDEKLWIMWCMWYWNVDVIEDMSWSYTWMNEIILRILWRVVWISIRGHSVGILG